MDYLSFVQNFQKIVLERVSDKKQWAKEIAEILHISADAVYKKSRFKISYSLEEYHKLRHHYGIEEGDMSSTSDSEFIQFTSPLLNAHIKDPMDYLYGLQSTFTKLESIRSPKVMYTTRELPIFYYFMNPLLLKFKLYVFAKTVWEIPRFVNNKFNQDLFHIDMDPLSLKLWQAYRELHSEEFWTLNIFDNTIQQLVFFKNCGDISSEDFILIKTSIIDIINKCAQMAEQESKIPRALYKNFQLFENKIMHTSNHIMVTSAEKDFMYFTFDNPNYIYTDDAMLMNYSKSWYSKIRKNSYALGEGSGHLRYQYFNALIAKAESC